MKHQSKLFSLVFETYLAVTIISIFEMFAFVGTGMLLYFLPIWKVVLALAFSLVCTHFYVEVYERVSKRLTDHTKSLDEVID